MGTSRIPVTTGSGLNVATYSVTESAVNIELQRIVLSKSDGTEGGLVNATCSGVFTLSNTQVSIGNTTVSVTAMPGVTVSGWANVTASGTVQLAAGTSVIGAVKIDKINYTSYWFHSTLTVGDTTVWTPNAGSTCCITDVVVSASYAGTFTLVDGTGVGTGSTIMIAAIGANGGMSKNFHTAIAARTAGNVVSAKASVTGMSVLIAGYEV